jgi:hypothetical protein
VTQRLHSLLQFEMPQILLHHVGHSHAQRSRKILCRQALQFSWIPQQADQALGKTFCTSRRIKFDRQLFPNSHLAKIGNVCRNNRHTVSAGKMGHAAASGGRRVRHHGHTGALE